MLNFHSLFFPAHVRAQVHVCQALTVTWLCLPPLFFLFPGLCSLVRVLRVPPGHRLHFSLGPWKSARSFFLFRGLAWQFRLARSLKAAFALSGPVVSGSQGPVPVSQCPSLRPQVAFAARYPSAPQPVLGLSFACVNHMPSL